MNYNQKKHHRRSIWLAEYDYSKGGAYFVTICTRSGEQILANPPKPIPPVWVALAATHPLETSPNPEPDSALQSELTPIGEIVDRNWRTLPERFPMVSLDEYVIMPNHFHGILFINESEQSRQRDAGERVGARPTPTAPISPPTPTLGMIVGTFKSCQQTISLLTLERVEFVIPAIEDVLVVFKDENLDQSKIICDGERTDFG